MTRTAGAPLQGVTYWPVVDFSLYDDGHAIYTIAGAPWTQALRHARLSPEQVDALMADAAGPGGLSTDRYTYDDVLVEAYTYFHYLDGIGPPKWITVQGLGFNDPDAPSAGDRAKFLWLAERLGNFDNDVSAGKAQGLGEFHPADYRVWLLEPYEGMSANAEWPWPDLTIGDFQRLPNTDGPSRLVTYDQGQRVIDLAVETNLVVLAADGSEYQITIQPMLPLDYRAIP
jgi:hypothetical protein